MTYFAIAKMEECIGSNREKQILLLQIVNMTNNFFADCTIYCPKNKSNQMRKNSVYK